MKSTNRIAAALVVVLSTGATASATQQTATLHVENVSCISCAPIVKRSLSAVPGVSQVTVAEVNETATATVTYDDARTNVAALIKATTNAGFPSQAVQ